MATQKNKVGKFIFSPALATQNGNNKNYAGADPLEYSQQFTICLTTKYSRTSASRDNKQVNQI